MVVTRPEYRDYFEVNEIIKKFQDLSIFSLIRYLFKYFE